jgi:ribonucleoside-diphosphate reductase beta chain
MIWFLPSLQVPFINQVSYIGRKSAWVQRYLTDSVDHFSLRIVSLAVYNKIVQSALIDLLLLLQGKLFPGLFHLVAKIRADHQQYFQMCLLVQSQLTNRPSQEKVNQMLAAAVEAEKSLLVELKELSGGRLQIVDPIEVSSMNQRIEAEADSLLLSLGYSKLYNTKDPLAWINEMADKEARKYDTIEIQKPKASAVMQKSMSDAPFSVDEDF